MEEAPTTVSQSPEDRMNSEGTSAPATEVSLEGEDFAVGASSEEKWPAIEKMKTVSPAPGGCTYSR